MTDFVEKLNSLGPEKFSTYIKDFQGTFITDTTMRDAHQSLLATRMRTDDIINIAEFYSNNLSELFSIESTTASILGKKRLIKALSSRSKPSKMCSVSIRQDPNWLASYRAKKITLLAFSVYFSNMVCTTLCGHRADLNLSEKNNLKIFVFILTKITQSNIIKNNFYKSEELLRFVTSSNCRS